MPRITQIIICFVILSIIIILLLNKVTIKQNVSLPLEGFHLNNYFYLILVFIIFLIALLNIILRRSNILTTFSKVYLHFFENIKQNLDFVVIYLNSNYINFSEIYRYLNFHNKQLLKIYLLTTWCIRILVFIFFVLDVFYFNHLNYFYKVLPSMLSPFFFKLIYYIVKRFFDIQCNKIKHKVQPFVFYINSKISGVIPLKDYIHQTSLKLLKIPENPFRGTILLDPEFVNEWENNNGKTLDREKTLSNYKKETERLILNYIVIYRFETQKVFYDTFFNIIIRSGYLLGWIYIFYITDTRSCILLLKNIINIYTFIEEPFSGLFF